MTAHIEIDNLPYWQERIKRLDEMAHSLEDSSLHLAEHYPGIAREINMYSAMVDLVKALWDMTEIVPGEAAGLTLELPDQEARLAVREKIDMAVSIGENLQTRVKSAT